MRLLRVVKREEEPPAIHSGVTLEDTHAVVLKLCESYYNLNEYLQTMIGWLERLTGEVESLQAEVTKTQRTAGLGVSVVRETHDSVQSLVAAQEPETDRIEVAIVTATHKRTNTGDVVLLEGSDKKTYQAWANSCPRLLELLPLVGTGTVVRLLYKTSKRGKYTNLNIKDWAVTA